jgi:hypothetical protein
LARNNSQSNVLPNLSLLEKTALHEAAHVVACMALGVRFHWVGVNSRGAGEVCADLHEHPAFERAVICMCGPLAERRVTGVDEARAWAHDTRMAESAIRRLATNDGDSVVPLNGAVRACANDLVTANWDQICLLAAVLTERKRMTYGDVRRVLQRHGNSL